MGNYFNNLLNKRMLFSRSGDKTKEIYSEVEQLLRLFNAGKSKIKIKIGAGTVKSEI